MENIDNITFFVLLSMLLASIFLNSEFIGAISLIFSFLVIFKSIFSLEKFNFKLENYHKALIIFFLIVSVSLCASSLFKLSLHGYIKTLIYIIFFFSACIFYKNNKNKIYPAILFICVLLSYESIVAIIQNYNGVVEISSWQDMTHINPEEVLSRAYGTLKPYNPNLLAGYLLCGLSSFIFVIFSNLKEKRKKFALVFLILFLITLVAIIDTGCRGAYLGFLFFFPLLFLALLNYIYKRFGGLSNIKKRYKNLTIACFVGFLAFIFTNPAIVKRFETILAFRADSSISFRLNVYESAIKMFLDNPFLGIGVGNQNFRELYGLYMKTGYDALGCYCVPLEIMVESGIFALVSFILFLFFVVKKCYKICINEASQIQSKILALSVVLMIAAVMGHGLFDTIWFRPQVQFMFWTYIAMLEADK